MRVQTRSLGQSFFHKLVSLDRPYSCKYQVLIIQMCKHRLIPSLLTTSHPRVWWSTESLNRVWWYKASATTLAKTAALTLPYALHAWQVTWVLLHYCKWASACKAALRAFMCLETSVTNVTLIAKLAHNRRKSALLALRECTSITASACRLAAQAISRITFRWLATNAYRLARHATCQWLLAALARRTSSFKKASAWLDVLQTTSLQTRILGHAMPATICVLTVIRPPANAHYANQALISMDLQIHASMDLVPQESQLK